MKIGNIDRLLLFRVEGGQELTQADLANRYRFEPDGGNLYHGLKAGEPHFVHDHGTGAE